MGQAFTGYALDGKSHELDRRFPSRMRTWDVSVSVPDDGGTHFGYVHGERAATVSIPGPDANAMGQQFRLIPGMFFVIPGAFTVVGGEGVIITREGWRGLFQIGGPVEREGRLKYIDGCTDSLLVSPVRWGDPCLNLLYFPPGIDQTMHIHPSDRIGIVMSGRGRCVHWPAIDADPVYEDLVPGMAFCIHTDGIHKFQTPYGEEMRVLAYHPDSDFGPQDENHPMLNRTIIDGISAADPSRAQYRTE